MVPFSHLLLCYRCVVRLKLCGHRHQSVLADINAQHGALGELGQLQLSMQSQNACSGLEFHESSTFALNK